MVDNTYDRRLPERTQTKAYQGNSAVRVWISLKPGDLELDDQGIVKADLIETGDLSITGHDPFNINNSLQKIDFSYGLDGFTGFKIKLINPSVEFEATILSWYEYLYGKKDATVEFRDAVKQDSDSRNEEGLRKQENLGYPQLYIRWGYGASVEEGISSIHAAKVVGLNYNISVKKERVIEITLVDPFTFLTQGEFFNEEGIAATESIFEANGRLKPPSKIINELLAEMIASLPEFASIIDMETAGFSDQIDSMFYQLLLSLTQKDKLGSLKDGKTPIAALGDVKSDIFTLEERKTLESSLKIGMDPRLFLESTRPGNQDGNFGAILQAYKILFNELGLNFKQGRALTENEMDRAGDDRVISRQDIDYNPIYPSASAEDDLNREEQISYENFLDKDLIDLSPSSSYEFTCYPLVFDFDWSPRPATEAERQEIQEADFITDIPCTLPSNTGLSRAFFGRKFDFSINTLNNKLFNGNTGPIDVGAIFNVIQKDPRIPLVFVLSKEGQWKPHPYTEGNAEITSETESILKAILSRAYGEHGGSSEESVVEHRTVDPTPRSDPDFLSIDSLRIREYYVTFNSEDFESFYGGLEYLLSKLNKLCILRASKLWFYPINLSNLTIKEKQEILKEFYLSRSKQDILIRNSKGLLIISDQMSIVNKFGGKLTHKVHSFPEITGGNQGEQYADYRNRITLEVASDSSIVADLNFNGDLRVLSQIGSVPYSMDQLDNLKKIFTSEIPYADLIYHIISEAGTVSTRWSSLPSGEVITLQKGIRNTESAQTINNSKSVFSEDFIKLLPLAVSELKKQNEHYIEKIQDKFPEVTDQIINDLLSLMSSDSMFEVMFPLADIDRETQMHKNSSYFVLKGESIEVETRDYISTRRVAINTALDKSSKQSLLAVDSNMQTWDKLSDIAWVVDIVTLGIPELDIPIYEVTTRVVNLIVREERVPGALHWLTGLYQIVGLQHAISPSSGYLTKLKLLKVPYAN